jgi:hypothetical protein
MPDPSGIIFNNEGKIIYSTSRDVFFYTSLFIFVLIQILLFIFNKLVLAKRQGINIEIISTWFQGIALAINLFIILMVIFIGLANNAIDYSFSSIQFIAYLAPSFLILWLLALPFILFFSKK